MGEKCMNCKHFVKIKHGIRGALKGCYEIRNPHLQETRYGKSKACKRFETLD